MSVVEIFGFVTGAVCVWLAVRENVWTWPIALANAVFFFVLFLRHQIYGAMALQILFFGIAVLGWYRWLRGGEHHSPLRVSSISSESALGLGVLTVASTAALTVYLQRIGDAAPVLDATTTVLSVVGQYLLARKVIENWYVWMAADVLYVWLYASQGLYLTAILYVIFFAMCVAGAVEWRRSFLSPSVLQDPSPAE